MQAGTYTTYGGDKITITKESQYITSANVPGSGCISYDARTGRPLNTTYGHDLAINLETWEPLPGKPVVTSKKEGPPIWIDLAGKNEERKKAKAEKPTKEKKTPHPPRLQAGGQVPA